MTDQPDTAPNATALDIVYVTSPRVQCDGGAGIHPRGPVAPAALGHPRVWLEIDEKGHVDCGYCDRRFVLKPGEAARH